MGHRQEYEIVLNGIRFDLDISWDGERWNVDRVRGAILKDEEDVVCAMGEEIQFAVDAKLRDVTPKEMAYDG